MNDERSDSAERQHRKSTVQPEDSHFDIAAADVAGKTLSVTAIVAIRIACQAGALILSIRLLGVDAFGTVAAIVAISLLLGPWSGLGCDFVALRAVSRDVNAAGLYFWRGVRTIGWSSLLLVAMAAILTQVFFVDRLPVVPVVFILCAELMFLRTAELLAKVLQGQGHVHQMALVRLSISASRLFVLVALVLTISSLTVSEWAAAYLAASILTLVTSIHFVRQLGASNVASFSTENERQSDGLHFAAGITAGRLNSEFDKVLVLGMAGATSAGLYAAAYRLVTLAAEPVINFVNIVIGSLFRGQLSDSPRFLQTRARSYIVVGAAYGLVAGFMIWVLLQPVTQLLFGATFAGVVNGIMPLALLPIPLCTRIVADQSMAAYGLFWPRSIAQWAVAIVAVGSNYWLIPVYGWTAAVWVLLAAESVLSLTYLICIYSERCDIDSSRSDSGRST